MSALAHSPAERAAITCAIALEERLRRRATRLRLTAVFAALAAMGAVGAGLTASRGPTPQGTSAAVAAVPTAVAEAKRHGRVAATIDTARDAVVNASADREPDELARDALWVLAEQGDWASVDALLDVWAPGSNDVDGCDALVNFRIETAAWQEARWHAWRCARRFPESRAHFVSLFYAAHARDPDFLEPPVTLVPGLNVQALTSMNRSSSVILRYLVGGRTVGVFKPNQDVPHTNYRGEIAAWRLCQLIHCDVAIPYNHEVRIAEADLERVSGISGVRRSAAMEGSRGNAVWYRDSEGTWWLYGAYKAWVDDLVKVELESYSAWQPMLCAGRSAEELRAMPMTEAFSRLPRIREMAESAPRATAFHLAHQLSDMHVLDALIGNFDRYHDHLPGLNIHWSNGRLLSLDNGASFLSDPRVAWDDPFRRLQAIELFSRDTIDAIRWMDTDALFRTLLPETPLYDDDERRWELFLERRERLLARVDALIAEHGEDAVLVFP